MLNILLHVLICNFTRFFQGAAIDRIVYEIIHSKYSGPYSSIADPSIQFDFVMCLGHFLSKVPIFGVNDCIVLKIL
jgi:hypothetical protein